MTCPVAGMGDLCSVVAVRSPMAHVRAPDTHDQNLSATRVRKIPDTASAAMAAVAVSESAKQFSPNTAAIRKWFSQSKSDATLPDTMAVGPKGQVA